MRYAKAILGAVAAGLGTLQIALADESVTAAEWGSAVVAALLTLAAVWGVPNAGQKVPPAE